MHVADIVLGHTSLKVRAVTCAVMWGYCEIRKHPWAGLGLHGAISYQLGTALVNIEHSSAGPYPGIAWHFDCGGLGGGVKVKHTM